MARQGAAHRPQQLEAGQHADAVRIAYPIEREAILLSLRSQHQRRQRRQLEAQLQPLGISCPIERRGEICAVRWTDYDQQGMTITVATQLVQVGWQPVEEAR